MTAITPLAPSGKPQETNMSEEQQIQFDRFIAAGYTPDQAAQLIRRGAWLQTGDEQDETWADIRRYREEVAAQAERIAVPE